MFRSMFLLQTQVGEIHFNCSHLMCSIFDLSIRFAVDFICPLSFISC